MIALLLALHVAQAADLPPIPAAPVRAPDQALDCTSKAPQQEGSRRDCDAVSVPPSYLAYLEESLVYSGQLRLHLVGSHAVMAADAKTAADQIAWRDQQLTQQLQARQQRPVLEAVAYVALGSAMAIGVGWSMGQIAR